MTPFFIAANANCDCFITKKKRRSMRRFFIQTWFDQKGMSSSGNGSSLREGGA